MENNNKEDIEEWLEDTGASLNITYTRKNLTNIEECKIDVTVGNVQNTKCDLKNTVYMKLQGEETVKLNGVLYFYQAVRNILSVLRLVSKGHTMGDTQYKTTINKNGVNIILDTRKGKNKSKVLYLKAKKYAPEGYPTEEAQIKFLEEKEV